MSKKAWIRLEDNSEVTDYYLTTIGIVFSRANYDVKYIRDYKELNPNSGDVIVTSTVKDMLKVLKYRNAKKVLWVQGTLPDESFMRNKSKIRYLVLSIIEYIAFLFSDFVFFVSETMKSHYCKKYKMKFHNSYVMACSNEEIHPNMFKYEGKYTENNFCYAGGTFDAWHCFEETIQLYSLIEKKHPDSKILLLVKDKEYALQLLEKYNVKNFEIDFVPVDKIQEKLRKIKYGFILRKRSAVNSVATPTKAMTYMANGVIPIFSNCLEGLDNMLKDNIYKVTLSNNNDIRCIEDFMGKKIDADAVLHEYQNTYSKYYDREMHIDNITLTFKECGLIKE